MPIPASAIPAPARRPARWPVLLCTALLAVSGVAGCSPGRDGGKLSVVAAFYPLQFIAQRIAGDDAEVTNLVKAGAEPHDIELTSSQAGKIVRADLVVYLKDFQPAVDEAVAQHATDRAFDAGSVDPPAGTHVDTHDDEQSKDEPGEDGHGREEKGHEHGAKDPHIWLDPMYLAAVADKLADRLGKAQPDSADVFGERAATLRDELAALDKEYRTGLATCQRREIFVSHAAFGYLTGRYDLEQIALAGLTPDQEPTSQRLAEVTRLARDHGATVIFFETLVSPKVAETLAREVGAEAKVLDPIEGIKPGTDGDYFSVMRTNLQTLRPALGCS